MISDVSLVKGIVVSSYKQDPQGLDRLQVYIPTIHGKFDPDKVGSDVDSSGIIDKYPWAQNATFEHTIEVPVYTPKLVNKQISINKGTKRLKFYSRIEVGSSVLVVFEANDTSFPVIIGMLSAGKDLLNTKDLTPDATSWTSGEGIGGVSTGDLAGLAYNLILENESKSSGSYKCVNWTEKNGYLSIGILQWNAQWTDRAEDLLNRIKAANPDEYNSLGGSCISNTPAGLTTKDCTQNSASGQALVRILGTETSKKVQDNKAKEDIQSYFHTFQSLGVTDPKCLVYLADFYNQSQAKAKDAIKNATNKNDLDSIHNASVATGIEPSRRQKSYEYVRKQEENGAFTTQTLSTLGEVKDDGSADKSNASIESGGTASSFYGNYAKPLDSLRPSWRDGTGWPGAEGHQGYDFAGNFGDPVYAIADGMATCKILRAPPYSKYKGSPVGYRSYGIHVELRFNGLTVIYAHLQKSLIPEGATIKVTKGQQIGELGQTGNAGGKHLHFEIRGISNSRDAYAQFVGRPW